MDVDEKARTLAESLFGEEKLPWEAHEEIAEALQEARTEGQNDVLTALQAYRPSLVGPVKRRMDHVLVDGDAESWRVVHISPEGDRHELAHDIPAPRRHRVREEYEQDLDTERGRVVVEREPAQEDDHDA